MFCLFFFYLISRNLQIWQMKVAIQTRFFIIFKLIFNISFNYCKAVDKVYFIKEVQIFLSVHFTKWNSYNYTIKKSIKNTKS